MEVRYAIIEEGSYTINKLQSDALKDEIIYSYMSWHCINKDRRLFVCYDSDTFCPTDSCDYQFVIKLNRLDTDNLLEAEIESLDDSDIEYIKSVRYNIFAIYSWWSRNIIYNLIKSGAIDIDKVAFMKTDFDDLNDCCVDMFKDEVSIYKFSITGKKDDNIY